jgi:hypothetical protein
VKVTGGLFNTHIDFDQSYFDGRALWLGITVGTDSEMTPRQEFRPVPYALSLVPGARVMGAAQLPLTAETTHPDGRAIRGYATANSGTNFGVVGASGSPDGYGGYFYNNEGGVGVCGKAMNETDSTAYGGYFTGFNGVYGKGTSRYHIGDFKYVEGHGVYGESTYGYGVYGTSDDKAGVYGKSKNKNRAGVHGTSTSGYGVYGTSTESAGVHGFGSAGVHGESWSDGGEGVCGVGTGKNTEGVIGISESAVGVYGMTSREDHRYGVFTDDYMYALDYESGGGDVAEYFPAPEDPEPGTVMVIDPAGGSKLRASTNAYDTTVAGIVSTAPGVSLGTKEDGNEGEKLIAVAGRVPCKVDASYAPVMPGDLLTTSDTPGHAMKATDPVIGTILGKALEPLDSGTGVIEVLVTLQ